MKCLNDQLKCARRELALRNVCYPKWVKEGRKSPQESEHEIQCVEAIVATLQKLIWLAEVSEEMKAAYARES